MDTAQELFSRLGLRLFERGWLSSNNVLFAASDHDPATVVDTGYAAHADQTLALIRSSLGVMPLGRIINSHLHSDHCGGNATLQSQWDVKTHVPLACLEAVIEWDASRLSFEATDQRCERFVADDGLKAASLLSLAGRSWEIHAAPGHDPTALMFFEPESRVLISADALWEQRLAIVFPELVGESGFDDCLRTLALIERLEPAVVIPGHGRPFSDVHQAIQASRARVEGFSSRPVRHRRYALRSLTMFHVFHAGPTSSQRLAAWLGETPISSDVHDAEAAEIVGSLVDDGLLVETPAGLTPAS